MRRRFTKPATEHAGPRPNLRTMLFTCVAGAVSVFAFAPFGYWALELATIAFLFYQVGLDTNVKRSAWIGWAFGLGWSVAGMHWLYIAMNRFGGMPAPLAAIAVVLLGAYMGLFAGLATAAATWLRRRWTLPVTVFLLALLPACWGLSEWLRGWLFTGIPWVVSGYAHTSGPLSGFAPVLGVYGLGLLAAMTAGAIVMLIQPKRWYGLGALVLLIGAGIGLQNIAWTTPAGMPLSVRLIQGNIKQEEKFDVAHLEGMLMLYHDLLTREPADLVAAPETAVPIFPHQLPAGFMESLAEHAKAKNTALMLGIPLLDAPDQYTNSVIGLAPHGGPRYRYDKHHLVPFGEFIPTGFRWFTNMMQIPLGDFRRGGAVQPAFAVKDQRVLPNICYEDLFGDEIATMLRDSRAPATILLNASNMAWYGESIAIPQHLQLSQMRAMETGRPMLRTTNNGATAVITAQGQISHQLAPFTRGTLAASVQGMQGQTPYIQFGNTLFLLLAGCGVACAGLSRRKTAKTS